ncbi:hypothetical protein [Providencia rettgeri]|uniref:hypothetical protein n=1 Tax=Providencia rettgeri TaxID=587 RepID=UPI0034E0AFB4
MRLVSALSVVGTIMGGVVLSMLIARFYPSLDPVNRLYAAVFLSCLVTMGLFVYNLIAPTWQRKLLRSYGWWPLPLALMVGGVL